MTRIIFHLMTFFSWGPFLFLLFLGFRGPFWKNLFTWGVNDFRQGSFLILWLFLSEASEALFCFLLFSGFRGPLRKNLFTQGGNDFQQGSFCIIWLLRGPFVFFRLLRFSTRIIFYFMLFLSAEASEALLSRSLIWSGSLKVPEKEKC